MNLSTAKIIRMEGNEGNGYDSEYFIVNLKDFDKAVAICKEEEARFYSRSDTPSLYEMIVMALSKNNIEFFNVNYNDVDYSF